MIKIIKQKNKIIEESGDKKIVMALLASSVILTIQYFILIYFNLLGTSNAYTIQLISKVLVGGAFVYALPTVLKRNKFKLMLTYIVTIFIFLLNYLIFPVNHIHLNELIFPVFFIALPAFVYSISVNNWDTLKQTMKKAALIVFLFGSTIGILTFAGKTLLDEYSMALSYYMLFPAIIFLDELLERYSFKALLVSVISLIVILAFGSRGAIMCITVFVILKLIRFNLNLTHLKLIKNLIVSLTIITMFVYLEIILEFIYNTLLGFGVNSRSILLFLKEDVHLSGREFIYQEAISAIFEYPLIGLGLAGDRHFTETVYAHNFFLEVLVHFGILFGGILLILVLLLILKALSTSVKERYSMYIIWLSLGFVPLMVSGSYLIEINFWIFIGLITNSLINGTNSFDIS